MLYKEQLQKYDLKLENLTKAIKTQVADLNELISDHDDLKKEIENGEIEDDEQLEEANEALQELQEEITEKDKQAAASIKKYGVSLKQRTRHKEKAAQPAQPPVAPEGAVVVEQTKPVEVVIESSEQKPKKSNGLFLGVLGVAALVLTLGAVNTFKSK